MFDTPNVVRYAVSLYIVLGGFAAFYLWRNAAAPNALQNAGIILAGLIPAFIAVLPYVLKTTELKNESNLVIFFNEETKQVISTKLFSPYLSAYSSLFANLEPSALVSRNIEDNEVPKDTAKQYWPFFHKEKGFDLIERLILITFAREFHGHWDVEYQFQQTPWGESKGGKYSYRDSKEIKIFNIASQFEHNQLIRDHSLDIVPPYFKLPSNSKFSVQADDRKRTIIIETPGIGPLTISISPSRAGVAPGGVWGLIEPNENLVALQYNVITKLRYRPYAMKSKVFKRWFGNVSAAIEKLDWEKIDSEVERTLMREMLEKSNLSQ
jgi:hypothetical protein